MSSEVPTKRVTPEEMKVIRTRLGGAFRNVHACVETLKGRDVKIARLFQVALDMLAFLGTMVAEEMVKPLAPAGSLNGTTCDYCGQPRNSGACQRAHS